MTSQVRRATTNNAAAKALAKAEGNITLLPDTWPFHTGALRFFEGQGFSIFIYYLSTEVT